MDTQSNFIELKYSNKIWAIGSIHSDLNSFNSIKKYILENFTNKDKLVFLGNAIGIKNHAKETITSIVNMRNYLLSKFLLQPEDVVFLRGAQEEMFLKLLQLQTAPNPNEIVKWMFEHGVDKTIDSYGIEKKEVIEKSTQGTLSISRWTKKLNKIIANTPGHKEYFTNLRHAAFTDTKKILFVNRGVDVSRPLSAQNDCFWWGYQDFSKLDRPYNNFTKIVRGYYPSSTNNNVILNNKIVCSLYKQPLENNKIVAGIFNDQGEILDLFESK